MVRKNSKVERPNKTFELVESKLKHIAEIKLAELEPQQDRIQCKVCGRRFQPSSYEKHANIC
jgi:hypothetical protein